MTHHTTTYAQTVSATRAIEQMPDGSTAVFDTETLTVHSLNAGAAAAFAACKTARSLPDLACAMGSIMGGPVTEAAALVAVAELERAGLVRGSGGPQAEADLVTRRSLLKAAGIALPAVLSLTVAQQRAYAQAAGSGSSATILSVDPDDMNCSDLVDDMLVTGQNTHFGPTSVVTANVPWVTISAVRVMSATQLYMSVRASGAGYGQVDITVTTGSEVATGVRVLQVFACV